MSQRDQVMYAGLSWTSSRCLLRWSIILLQDDQSVCFPPLSSIDGVIIKSNLNNYSRHEHITRQLSNSKRAHQTSHH